MDDCYEYKHADRTGTPPTTIVVSIDFLSVRIPLFAEFPGDEQTYGRISRAPSSNQRTLHIPALFYGGIFVLRSFFVNPSTYISLDYLLVLSNYCYGTAH
jgi:hypothetical protein